MNKSSSVIIFLLLIIIGILLYNNYTRNPNRGNNTSKTETTQNPPKVNPANTHSIDQLTKQSVVVPYVKQNGHLPECYITKKEAREQGWNAAQGNLCEVLPGKAIGGDIFTNRERTLPVKKGRTWYEADLNYNCGNRNADRLLFSNDGMVFVTHDHYKTFEQQ